MKLPGFVSRTFFSYLHGRQKLLLVDNIHLDVDNLQEATLGEQSEIKSRQDK